ncbi:MAG: guanine deaminase [Deinococcales bacterium]
MLLRAPIFHTPKNPFYQDHALEVFEDGAIYISEGKIADLGDYNDVRRRHPDSPSRDLRDGVILPGFIDTHIHFPQVRVMGGLGMTLLEWLEHNTLPEEAKMSDYPYASSVAQEFLHNLLINGTTTALVFGCHFETGQRAFFEAAKASKLRIISGMVLSDRMLLESLHQTPQAAYQASKELIREFHQKDRLLYAVTPRFSLSASEAILEVCQSLHEEHQALRFTSHINENDREIATVKELFPWARDYLDTYERFGLVHEHSVFAHNVHPHEDELRRLSAAKAAVSHCPCSNAALGSGIFPMLRHVKARVKFSLGTDVGGGTGFGLAKEALQSYFLQHLSVEGYELSPNHLLYLATKAGAEALGLVDVGDLSVGQAADFIYLRPPQGSAFASVLKHAEDSERMLAAIFTLTSAESVAEVWVGGARLH